MSEWESQRDDAVRRMTAGEGYLPGQATDRCGASPAERAFRACVERRKGRILARRLPVQHPVLVTNEQLTVAHRNIAATDWGRAWYARLETVTAHVLAQPDDYVARMIPALTPTNPYGFTCPRCVGAQSQEGAGINLVGWDYREPEVIRCTACGQTLPDAAYPEDGALVCPRAGQIFTYYRNPTERADPANRSGALAWQWVWKPAHPSYSGIVRERKILFMLGAARQLGVMYRFTGDARCAERVMRILARLARCSHGWLYHDFYDTVADCDPLYAAWHDMVLPLAWKRNPTALAYAGSTYETGPVDDHPDRAKMLATFFGCGRVHPSADSGVLDSVCQAYDLVHDAPQWTPEQRALVEHDLILEMLIGAEPFIGGPGRATNLCNKAPYVYHAMASAARCLGLPGYAHVALRGYEALRDHAFHEDGFSDESPAYTNMFLASMLWVPEKLQGFRWSDGYRNRRGAVDVFAGDAKLRQIMRTAVEQLQTDGCYLPLSDTPVGSAPNPHVFEIGAHRCPEIFAGILPTLYRANGSRPTEYALFHLTLEETTRDAMPSLPETWYPDWMTAVLRHGVSVLTLAANPPGVHRHKDNLGIFYTDRGRTILGEQGYVCDTPQIDWAHATACHNLVVVDDEEQLFSEQWGSPRSRVPGLRLFAVSPSVSVVEAESMAYPQCAEYRRLVALIKGPGDATFAVDIFRLHGGRRHSFRLFSEIAASGAPEGRREFDGLNMPPEPSLPEPGKSMRLEDVFGLRDAVAAADPPAAWQAVWTERDAGYRLWMVSPVDRVEASNGPGQETLDQTGRRVRYLDAIREGEDLRSVFVAVHESGGPDGSLPIISVERLSVPADAGADAVALRIDAAWGTYLIFSEFDREVEIDGVCFQGWFGVFHRDPYGVRRLFSCGAETLMAGGFGHAGAPARWEGRVVTCTEDTLTVDSAPPVGWPAIRDDVCGYVLIGEPGRSTGYAVAGVEGRSIRVERFPLQPAKHFVYPAVRWRDETEE